MLKLETKRLILRNFIEEDLDDFYDYASKEDVGPRAGWNPYTDKDSAKNYLEKAMKRPFQFAIVLKEKSKVIGCIEIENCDREKFGIAKDNDIKEIGAVLNSDYWNKGYMTEAMQEIIKYCFEQLKLKEVYACNASLNIGSKRIQEKSGMKIFKIIKNVETWVNDEVCDKEIRVITKQEYGKVSE